MDIESVDGGPDFWADGAFLVSCLHETTPRIPPHYGYDEVGSELFEEITDLPDYYLTRVEDRLLRSHVEQIASKLGTPWVAELGSGSAKKSRALLAACAVHRPTTFLPIDVSRHMLSSSAAEFASLDNVSVHGLWGRYEAGLRWLRENRAAPLTVMILGSTLANTTPSERHDLLTEVSRTLRPGDRFLVSADLVKPRQVFDTCYNDPPGRSVFERFRLNHLAHLNRRFGGDFVLDRFRVQAHYNEETTTVEGHLYATEDHEVSLDDLEWRARLRAGDSINVGFSAKFDPTEFIAELSENGLDLDGRWVDSSWQYGLFLFQRRGHGAVTA